MMKENIKLQKVAAELARQKLPHNLEKDVCSIIEKGRKQASDAVGNVVINTNWLIGQRIVEEEQHGELRAQYGARLIKELASRLVPLYGSAYNKRNLEYCRQFYLLFRNDIAIVNARVHNLTWTHFRIIMRESSLEGRLWYVKEASEQMWSTRTLDRNVSTQYYARMLAAQRESLALPAPEIAASDPLEYIKNPVVAEFLGFHRSSKYNESQLEQALIANLQQFIMELGRGFAFVDRQKHIYAGGDDYFVDLVFYNINLHAYVLLDLKTHKLTHQDVGQMDMYVRMYDDLIKGADDNPTIGILLCTDTNEEIARYSVLKGNNQLFAAKYMAYMPTEEELRNEIEHQKRFFLEQQADKEGNV